MSNVVDPITRWPNGKFVTANIVVNPEYLKANPDVIKKLVEANVNETQWINNNKEEALKVYNTELKKLTGQTIPDDQLKAAFSKLEITYDPIKQSLFKSANDAFDIGFLGKTRPDLSGIYDLTLLNEVLKEKGLQAIGDEPLGSANSTTTAAANSTTTAATNSTNATK